MVIMMAILTWRAAPAGVRLSRIHRHPPADMCGCTTMYIYIYVHTHCAYHISPFWSRRYRLLYTSRMCYTQSFRTRTSTYSTAIDQPANQSISLADQPANQSISLAEQQHRASPGSGLLPCHSISSVGPLDTGRLLSSRARYISAVLLGMESTVFLLHPHPAKRRARALRGLCVSYISCTRRNHHSRGRAESPGKG